MNLPIPSETNVNVEKICRICLSNKGRLKDIYRGRIPKMIETCASVWVVENDGLPRNICALCFCRLKKMYAFKRKIEHSDKYLRKIIKNDVKRSDILNMALTKANINDKSANAANEDEMSDEDIPLSERMMKQKSGISSGPMKKVEVTIEPPPLIPLAFETRTEAENAELNLPPLIPINPGVNINILENIGPVLRNEELHCQNCDERFEEVASFNEHKQKTCKKQNSLQCNICKKKFIEKTKLIRHLKGHTFIEDYCCKICPKRYPNASKFRNHMLTHQRERPFSCPTCNKGFVTRGGLDRHSKTHGESRPYICDVCGRSFKVPEYLEKHKKLHTNIRPFSCLLCDKYFLQSHNLEVHNLTYHTNERPFLCSVCGKGFVSSSRLKRHMGVHTDLKPYACQYCPKTYTTSKNLRTHEQHHLNRNGDGAEKNCCHVCNRKFSHPWRLAKHKEVHERTHQCQECNKSYSSENLLNKHLIALHGYIENELPLMTEHPVDLDVCAVGGEGGECNFSS